MKFTRDNYEQTLLVAEAHAASDKIKALTVEVVLRDKTDGSLIGTQTIRRARLALLCSQNKVTYLPDGRYAVEV